MQITFLGTSSGVPTKARNVSAVALKLPQRAEVWLFDCGEATQHQLQHTDLRISQLRRIFITHLHGDHLYGLLGLLATCGMAGNAQPIDIYGPPGLDEYVRMSAQLSRLRLGEQVQVRTVQPGLLCEDAEFAVSCQPLRHRVTAFGYRVTEKDRAGRFNAERAAELGIPAGPLYGRLKRGETITLADGRTINGAELCAPPERGRALAYCTDTTFCANSVALARDADVLIHEATFVAEDEELAHQSMHSTAPDAAEVARQARVRQLVLTHISPRYAPGNPIEAGELLRQARAVFPQTIMAQDFMTLEIPRRAA
ncbi:MAG TPA: ribonuclease Z [Pyrinomonadaceae bacterium]